MLVNQFCQLLYCVADRQILADAQYGDGWQEILFDGDSLILAQPVVLRRL
jgi:hypothetical protein